MRYIVLFFVLNVSLLVACNDDSEGSVTDADVQSAEEELSALETDVSDLEEEKSSLENDIETKEDELSDLKNETEELVALKEDREELENAKGELESTNSEIKAAKNELSELEEEITEVKDEPIEVSPGYYYFGEDIDAGRYELRPQEGYRGNIFVKDLDGVSTVADTFGHEEGVIDEFTFWGEEGFELEATIPILLYPVE